MYRTFTTKDTNTFAITYADEPNELYVFGGNPVTIDQRYMPERNAINSENGDRISKLKIAVIRNAADSRFTVTNTQTGEVLAGRFRRRVPRCGDAHHGLRPHQLSPECGLEPQGPFRGG